MLITNIIAVAAGSIKYQKHHLQQQASLTQINKQNLHQYQISLNQYELYHKPEKKQFSQSNFEVEIIIDITFIIVHYYLFIILKCFKYSRNLLYSQLILDKFLTLGHIHQTLRHQLTFIIVFDLLLLFQFLPLNHHHFHHPARQFGYHLDLINSHHQNLLIHQMLNQILLVIHLLLLNLRCSTICFFLHYHPLCCHEFIKY